MMKGPGSLSAEQVRAAWAAAERLQSSLDVGALVPADADEAPAAGLLRRDLEALIALADAACACGGEHYCAAQVRDAAAAARTLIQEHNLADWVYDVRSRAGEDASFHGNTWEHPKVKSFANAVETLRAFGESVTFAEPEPAPAPADFSNRPACPFPQAPPLPVLPPDPAAPAPVAPACRRCGKTRDERGGRERECLLRGCDYPACPWCSSSTEHHFPDCCLPVRHETLEQAAKLCEMEAPMSAARLELQRVASMIRGLKGAQ